MASSLKSVITAAIMKITTDERYSGIVTSTAEEARTEFIKALLAELFPDTEPPYVPPTITTVDQLAVALETMTVSAPAPVPAPAPEKKKPGRKPKLDADGNPVARKPRAKKEKGPVNIEKLNPTQVKRFKALCDERQSNVDKKQLLSYLNGMSKEEFDKSSLEEHMKALVLEKSQVSNAAGGSRPAEEDRECICVEFKGKEYWVDTAASPEKVYVTNPESGVDEYVGNVGFGEFAEMTIPDEEDA